MARVRQQAIEKTTTALEPTNYDRVQQADQELENGPADRQLANIRKHAFSAVLPGMLLRAHRRQAGSSGAALW